MKAIQRSRGICAGEKLRVYILLGGNLPFLKKMGLAMKGKRLWRGWDGDDPEIETDFDGLAVIVDLMSTQT